MAEYRFFTEGTVPRVSTFAFHAGRERAPHLEQDDHRPRLLRVAELVRDLAPASVVDLGCGDGGLLSLLKTSGIEAWGYDFQPSNRDGWRQRGVTAYLYDVLNHKNGVDWAQLTVLTEVLEHLADPHGIVEWVASNTRYLVASSPWGDTPEHHGAEHAWGWDHEGYRDLIEPHFEILTHDTVTWSQIITGRSRRQ